MSIKTEEIHVRKFSDMNEDILLPIVKWLMEGKSIVVIAPREYIRSYYTFLLRHVPLATMKKEDGLSRKEIIYTTSNTVPLLTDFHNVRGLGPRCDILLIHAIVVDDDSVSCALQLTYDTCSIIPNCTTREIVFWTEGCSIEVVRKYITIHNIKYK